MNANQTMRQTRERQIAEHKAQLERNEAAAKADREEALREAQAHRMTEQNRIVRILREQGVDEAVIDKVQNEEG